MNDGQVSLGYSVISTIIYSSCLFEWTSYFLRSSLQNLIHLWWVDDGWSIVRRIYGYLVFKLSLSPAVHLYIRHLACISNMSNTNIACTSVPLCTMYNHATHSSLYVALLDLSATGVVQKNAQRPSLYLPLLQNYS